MMPNDHECPCCRKVRVSNRLLTCKDCWNSLPWGFRVKFRGLPRPARMPALLRRLAENPVAVWPAEAGKKHEAR
jgi:hypothetical protein